MSDTYSSAKDLSSDGQTFSIVHHGVGTTFGYREVVDLEHQATSTLDGFLTGKIAKGEAHNVVEVRKVGGAS